jgi:predicted oxidoreductase
VADSRVFRLLDCTAKGEHLMKTYRIPGADLTVSRLAYGVGMLSASWIGADFFDKTVRAIRTAHENGITFFDTADVYAEGRSEKALCRYINNSSALRDHLVIQSKCGLRVRAGWEPDAPVDPDTMITDLSGSHIVSAVEGSLKRLGTDRLDVLLLHAPSPLMEPGEIAQAFDQLQSSGKVLHFGVCSHNVVQIELLKKYVRQPLVFNQIWLSLVRHGPLAERSGFGALVDYCRLHNIQVQAYSPLKGGSIFSKPLLLDPPPDAAIELRQLAKVLEEAARCHDATAAAVMLAWLLRHPAGIIPIVGASNPEHIVENCVADRIDLSHEEWQVLYAAAIRMQSVVH